MTYRVVKIDPCEKANMMSCADRVEGGSAQMRTCLGCRGDGTRMVDVAEVEPDDWSDVGIPKPVWVEVKS